jgi:hypothetical protein
MGKRVFAMSGFKGSAAGDHNERLARLDVAKEAMLDMVLGHPKVQAAGITRDQMENVQRYISGLTGDRHPTLSQGPSGEARVDSGDTVSLTDSYVNAHGETIIEGYRKNGPHVERVRLAEERVDPRTKMITRRLRGM